MNCREAEQQIFAERDGTLDPGRRAAVAEHVAQCASCRRISEGLVAAVGIWKTQAQAVAVPDAERAWQDVRRQIRQDTAVAPERHRDWRIWIGAPLTAAAAVAAIIALNPTSRDAAPGPGAARTIARAEYVEVPSATTSTTVFVDDKSGWLVVLASDAPRRF